MVELLVFELLINNVDVAVLLGGRGHLATLAGSGGVGAPHSEAALGPLLVLGKCIGVEIRYHLDDSLLRALEAVPVDLEVCGYFGDLIVLRLYPLDFAMVVFLFHVLGAIFKLNFGLR